MSGQSQRITHHPLLRHRDGHHAKVTYEELFFDLVYVFAVTQISHALLHHLTLLGALEALVLWFGVWLGWQYTAWLTNWFDPERPRIRMVLFASMLAALGMSAAIPHAFEETGLIFAGCYVAIQFGRTAFICHQLGRDHILYPNYRRMMVWLAISGCFWIAGGLAGHGLRLGLGLWAVAVLCEYVSPMIGFRLPFMGRSHTREWTIDGGHLAERCQLIVIIALGETLLATGGTLSQAVRWDAATLSATLATFFGTLALWWLYFGTSSKDATEVITGSDDPGRIGARFHYIHAVLIFGIIVGAVGNDLAMEHPGDHATLPQLLVIVAGPAIYLLGSAIYKHMVYGRVPVSHIAGAVLLAASAPIGLAANLMVMGWVTTVVLFAVGLWDSRAPQCRELRPAG
ncbi:MAG TPA: low temperature requirement protein A [Sphingobium sp.]